MIWRLVPESRDPVEQQLQTLPLLQSIVALVLVVYAIIKGNGPVVKKGQTIVANYLGQIFPDGKVGR